MSRRPETYAKTEARKRQILAAALDCFLEKGFAETTMKDVARRSGASNGSIYHHFGAKEGLARALYLSGIASYQEAVAAGLTGGPGAERGVSAMISGHLFWVEENQGWARFLSTMRHAGFMSQADPEMAEINRAWAGNILSWQAGCISAGELAPLSPFVFLSLILGPCQELTRLWLSGAVPGRPADYCEELSRAAWQAVRRT